MSDPNSGPKVDGFQVGNFNTNFSVYIGRSGERNLGRAQATPAEKAGVYYLNQLNLKTAFDNSPHTAEYLVKNPNYHYKFVQSRNGVKVHNALGLHREGNQSFYIGIARILENTYVGKVIPGEGLVFIDKNDNRVIITSYEVLTCTSPDVANGINEKESDENWYGGFWCPAKKIWSYEREKCICQKEFGEDC